MCVQALTKIIEEYFNDEKHRCKRRVWTLWIFYDKEHRNMLGYMSKLK